MNLSRITILALALASAAPSALAQPMQPTSGAIQEAGGVDPDTVFKGQTGGTFGKSLGSVLPAAKRIAVPSFRVLFITSNSVTAQVRQSYLPGRDRSGARSSTHMALQGVDARTMQAITDKAYADFLAHLAKSGREVVPREQMAEHFSMFTASPGDASRPYTKEHQGQTAMIFAPTGMPLVFTHFDQGWGDRGMFDLNNYRRLEEISGKLNAAVVAPVLVLNFARMTSSGNQSGLIARTAETGAEPLMHVSWAGGFYTRATEFRNGMQMGGDQASFQATAAFESAMKFGTMQETASDDNAATKGLFDALGKGMGLANAGGAARSSSKGVLQTSNDAYAAAALDALGKSTSALGAWFAKYPPAN